MVSFQGVDAVEASLVHDKDRILTRPKIIVGTLDSRQGSSLNEPCEYLQILIKSLFSAFVTYFTRNSEVHVLCSFNTFNCRTVAPDMLLWKSAQFLHNKARCFDFL